MEVEQPAATAAAATVCPGAGAAYDPALLAQTLVHVLVAALQQGLQEQPQAVTFEGVMHPKGGASASAAPAAHLQPRGGVHKRSGRSDAALHLRTLQPEAAAAVPAAVPQPAQGPASAPGGQGCTLPQPLETPSQRLPWQPAAPPPYAQHCC